MSSQSLNLRGLLILVADPSPYMCMLIHGMLRAFGATKVIEAKNSVDAFKILSQQKVDILLCDSRLRPHGGLTMTNSIRRNTDNENRTMPILLMTSDTRDTTIKYARDAGANMVIAKPMSPAALYDRLSWVALSRRQFVDAPSYFGPDRRFKIEGYPGGVGRRKGDNEVEVGRESGPTLAQDDIDSLFASARSGQA